MYLSKPHHDLAEHDEANFAVYDTTESERLTHAASINQSARPIFRTIKMQEIRYKPTKTLAATKKMIEIVRISVCR